MASDNELKNCIKSYCNSVYNILCIPYDLPSLTNKGAITDSKVSDISILPEQENITIGLRKTGTMSSC